MVSDSWLTDTGSISAIIDERRTNLDGFHWGQLLSAWNAGSPTAYCRGSFATARLSPKVALMAIAPACQVEGMSRKSSPSRVFTVGQKIRCIDDAFPRCIVDWCNSVPVAGEVYTIRGIQLGANPTTGHRDAGFLLAEIFNPRTNGRESGFFHTRFIPWLDADATSISATEQRELQGVT